MNDFQSAIEILTQGERHRVWSLIVTVFGDLARNDGDEISAQTLGKLTEPLGVKSEALRVALHRLRKEGWLESRRSGRSSSYFLAQFGQSQTTIATPRIYCDTTPEAYEWVLLQSSGNSEETSDILSALENGGHIIRLNGSSYIGGNLDNNLSAELFLTRIDQSNLPEWVKKEIVSETVCESYAKLSKSFAGVLGRVSYDFNPIERAALRTLIVHSWRRIRLRHLDVPASFFPEDCQASKCKELYQKLL